MRLSSEFMKREMAGEIILVPTDKMATQFNGMITLNQTGTFIYECLEEGMEEEQIVELMLDEFKVEEEVLREEVHDFLRQCKKLKIIQS